MRPPAWTTCSSPASTPRIHDRGLDPTQALGDYVETYAERDVRRMLEVKNLTAFQRFVRLCAGRVGQLLNLASLGADAGVTHATARQWLSVLEASYIVFRLPPYHGNLTKRLVKSPKLYFHDVGLASCLVGIESVRQVRTHPLRGALFENAVVVEALKHGYNRGRRPELSFFRDSRGLECDPAVPLRRPAAGDRGQVRGHHRVGLVRLLRAGRAPAARLRDRRRRPRRRRAPDPYRRRGGPPRRLQPPACALRR